MNQLLSPQPAVPFVPGTFGSRGVFRSTWRATVSKCSSFHLFLTRTMR